MIERDYNADLAKVESREGVIALIDAIQMRLYSYSRDIENRRVGTSCLEFSNVDVDDLAGVSDDDLREFYLRCGDMEKIAVDQRKSEERAREVERVEREALVDDIRALRIDIGRMLILFGREVSGELIYCDRTLIGGDYRDMVLILREDRYFLYLKDAGGSGVKSYVTPESGRRYEDMGREEYIALIDRVRGMLNVWFGFRLFQYS